MNQFRRQGLIDYGRQAIYVAPDALRRFIDGCATNEPLARASGD
jgi:hypothetical protein